MSSGEVHFDDSEVKSLYQLIESSEKEFIGLTSAFRISRPIPKGIDAIIVSTLYTKTLLKSFASYFFFHISGAVLRIEHEAILRLEF